MSFGTQSLTRLGYVRRYPFDLAAVSLAAIVAYAVVTSTPNGSAIRLLAALTLAVFFPGYALVAVLFPATARRDAEHRNTAAAGDGEVTSTEDGESVTTEGAEPVTADGEELMSADDGAEVVGDGGVGSRPGAPRGIDVVERLGLSFATSLALVALVALVLPVTAWGLGTDAVAASLAASTVGLAQVGAVRRLRVPEAERYVVAPLEAVAGLRRAESGVTTLSSIVLAVAIGLAVGALLLGVLAPASAGGFTQLGLYTNDGGDLVVGEIPDAVEPGESVPVTVAIANGEGERTEYAVVLQEQMVEDGAVESRTELDRLEATVADGETATTEVDIEPTANDGETVRIAVLLYQGEVPDEPSIENAETDAYFWVTVTEDAG